MAASECSRMFIRLPEDTDRQEIELYRLDGRGSHLLHTQQLHDADDRPLCFRLASNETSLAAVEATSLSNALTWDATRLRGFYFSDRGLTSISPPRTHRDSSQLIDAEQEQSVVKVVHPMAALMEQSCVLPTIHVIEAMIVLHFENHVMLLTIEDDVQSTVVVDVEISSRLRWKTLRAVALINSTLSLIIAGETSNEETGGNKTSLELWQLDIHTHSIELMKTHLLDCWPRVVLCNGSLIVFDALASGLDVVSAETIGPYDENDHICDEGMISRQLVCHTCNSDFQRQFIAELDGMDWIFTSQLSSGFATVGVQTDVDANLYHITLTDAFKAEGVTFLPALSFILGSKTARKFILTDVAQPKHTAIISSTPPQCFLYYSDRAEMATQSALGVTCLGAAVCESMLFLLTDTHVSIFDF